MQNGQRTITTTHRSKSPTPFSNRAKRWASNVTRPEVMDSQNAQRSYERYLALAQAQAQLGDVVGAENYYQHAEHYFRSMSSERQLAPSASGKPSADGKHDR